MKAYDKAKWHYDSDNFPEELSEDNGGTHIGIYLGWCIDNNLISKKFKKNFASEIEQFNKKKITAGKLLELAGDALVEDMLSKAGNAFAVSYYDAEGDDNYMYDYADVVSDELDDGDDITIYHAKDNRENYALVSKRVDERYADFLKTV